MGALCAALSIRMCIPWLYLAMSSVPIPKTIERTLNFFDFLTTTYLVPRQ
jgi:hypothetical protein